MWTVKGRRRDTEPWNWFVDVNGALTKKRDEAAMLGTFDAATARAIKLQSENKAYEFKASELKGVKP